MPEEDEPDRLGDIVVAFHPVDTVLDFRVDAAAYRVVYVTPASTPEDCRGGRFVVRAWDGSSDYVIGWYQERRDAALYLEWVCLYHAGKTRMLYNTWCLARERTAES